MATRRDRPSPGWPQWQPEPLRLPVMDNEPEAPHDRDERRRRDDAEDDLPGSHVVVIDLA